MKTRIIATMLFAASAAFAQNVGDYRVQYWTSLSPLTIATVNITPPSVPSIRYHDGTLGGEYFATAGDSLTIVSGKLEANWSNLVGKPTIGTAASANTGDFAPASHTHAQSDVTGLVSALSGKEATITAGTTSQYWRGDKSWQPHNAASISDGTTVGRALLTAADAAAARTAIGAGTGNGSGTVTSVAAGAGLSGGTITTTGTISMPNVGTPSTYSGVTTDAQGRVTAGTTRSIGAASRALNTAVQISSTRDALVSYSVDVSTTATLLGGQTGTVFLEYADDSAITTNVVEVARFVNGNTVSLAIAITVTQNVTGTLTGMVPAGKYVRIRTANTVGTPAFNYRSGQEALV